MLVDGRNVERPERAGVESILCRSTAASGPVDSIGGAPLPRRGVGPAQAQQVGQGLHGGFVAVAVGVEHRVRMVVLVPVRGVADPP